MNPEFVLVKFNGYGKVEKVFGNFNSRAEAEVFAFDHLSNIGYLVMELIKHKGVTECYRTNI